MCIFQRVVKKMRFLSSLVLAENMFNVRGELEFASTGICVFPHTVSGNNVHYLCTVGLEKSLKFGSENCKSFTGLTSHSEISVVVAFL